MKINYFGAMNMLELAHQCKNLLVYTHVSTIYVNCDKPDGLIKETIYEPNMEVDSLVKSIMALTPG